MGIPLKYVLVAQHGQSWTERSQQVLHGSLGPGKRVVRGVEGWSKASLQHGGKRPSPLRKEVVNCPLDINRPDTELLVPEGAKQVSDLVLCCLKLDGFDLALDVRKHSVEVRHEGGRYLGPAIAATGT